MRADFALIRVCRVAAMVNDRSAQASKVGQFSIGGKIVKTQKNFQVELAEKRPPVFLNPINSTALGPLLKASQFEQSFGSLSIAMADALR